MDRITKVKANPAKRIREGLWRCGDCKGQFTVKMGTVFEHARLPLHKALQAVYLMTSSKKGISAHQLHRVLESAPVVKIGLIVTGVSPEAGYGYGYGYRYGYSYSSEHRPTGLSRWLPARS